MKSKLTYRMTLCMFAVLALTALLTLSACTSLGEDAGRKSFESQRK